MLAAAVAGRLDRSARSRCSSGLLDDPARPFVAILGGAKVSDKLGVIGALIDRVDALLIGGAMAFTLIAAEGGEVGDSPGRARRFDEVRAAPSARGEARASPIAAPRRRRGRAGASTPSAATRPCRPTAIPRRADGPRHRARARVAAFADTIAGARTILWNGPMGVFELEPFAAGTRGVATPSPTSAGVHAWWAAATRSRRSRQSGWPTASTTSRPGAEPRWSSWRARDLPGLAVLMRGGLTMTDRRPDHRGELEDAQDAPGGDPGRAEARVPLDKDDAERVEVVICPPFTALRSRADADRRATGCRIALGAQNVHPEEQGRVHRRGLAADARGAQGARTSSSVTPSAAQLFGEDDPMVNKKVRAVFAHGMIPIVCVGETLEERDAGRHRVEGVAAGRAARSTDVDAEQAATAVIAYEPIWAIGTGRNADPADAGAGGRRLIRGDARRPLGATSPRPCASSTAAASSRGTSASFMAHPEIDGALVGGASLDPEDFALIVKYR